jgi:molybdopterin synthase catalytic subunit
MKRALTISPAPIADAETVVERKMTRGMGAVVRFAGVVRDKEGKAAITAIEYETFQAMAEHQFELIFDEIARKWPVESIRVVHRIGVVEVNQPSLWVEVIAPHREEAFAACKYLIDEMKLRVPIWKKPIEKPTKHTK